MKQVKFHRTELSLSVSGAEFCALSENEGLSLQKLQKIRFFIFLHAFLGEKSEKKTKKLDEICQIWVSGGLDPPKKPVRSGPA